MQGFEEIGLLNIQFCIVLLNCLPIVSFLKSTGMSMLLKKNTLCGDLCEIQRKKEILYYL